MSEEQEQNLTADEDFEQLLASSFDYSYTPPRRGEIREATILQIDEREIIVDLGAKQDGIVPSQDLERMDDEFRASLATGASVPVYVVIRAIKMKTLSYRSTWACSATTGKRRANC